MSLVRVELPAAPASSYSIHINAGALAALGSRLVRLAGKRRIAIISDSKVGKFYGGKLLRQVHASASGARLYLFPGGEKHKTRDTKARLEDRLLKDGFGRDSLLVALGGGVVGDLTGFLAATLHRGVPYVQVPTTLLAMADSSVGGKTAVDTPAGKNLIGAFWQPIEVVIDPSVLKSLPAREIRAGAAEVVKHGVIADKALFAYLEKNLDKLLSGNSAVVARGVQASCRIKAGVVSRDEREGGYRQILNFGHTIAHALELVRGYGLLHGDAVWAGMAVEARLAGKMGLLPAGDVERICAVLNRAFPIARELRKASPRAILAATASDKKARGGMARYALPVRIGQMGDAGGSWAYLPPMESVREALLETAGSRPKT